METVQLVELWNRARNRGENAYLATIVHVEGSSYRKPGARMLVTSGGERAGSISGGCLEAEIVRKIAWLTRNGACVMSYRSSFDDDNSAAVYGLGCGGTIWVLMEVGDSVDAVMTALCRSIEQRAGAVVIASLMNDGSPLTNVIAEEDVTGYVNSNSQHISIERMKAALSEGRVVVSLQESGNGLPRYIVMPVLPPQKLYIFGAGDDAQPVVRFASDLGWEVTVADGRSHLLRRERFPSARHLRALPLGTQASPGPDYHLADHLGMNACDCAVILTHSYEQDRHLLRDLLIQPLRYLGILGPLHRTHRILGCICREIELSEQECMKRLHAPVGLRIGVDNPAVIALSIVAEIQAQIAGVHIKTERSESYASFQASDQLP